MAHELAEQQRAGQNHVRALLAHAWNERALLRLALAQIRADLLDPLPADLVRVNAVDRVELRALCDRGDRPDRPAEPDQLHPGADAEPVEPAERLVEMIFERAPFGFGRRIGTEEALCHAHRPDGKARAACQQTVTNQAHLRRSAADIDHKAVAQR